MPCNAPPLVNAWIKIIIQHTNEIRPHKLPNARNIVSLLNFLQRVQPLDRVHSDPHCSKSHEAIDQSQINMSQMRLSGPNKIFKTNAVATLQKDRGPYQQK